MKKNKVIASSVNVPSLEKIIYLKEGTGKTESQTLNVFNLSLLKDNDHFFGGSKFHK